LLHPRVAKDDIGSGEAGDIELDVEGVAQYI
jgi:hypothetical protein